ncbi:MAG: hypothetical protein AAF921_20675 [Cyanobacteria bacterium P01_D01_bin.44]
MSKLNTQQLPITNDGTFAHHLALLQLLEMHLVRLGIQTCQCVLLIADGACWISNKIPPLLEQLGVPTDKVYQTMQQLTHSTQGKRHKALSQALDLHGRCHWAAGHWADFANSILTAGLT